MKNLAAWLDFPADRVGICGEGFGYGEGRNGLPRIFVRVPHNRGLCGLCLDGILGAQHGRGVGQYMHAIPGDPCRYFMWVAGRRTGGAGSDEAVVRALLAYTDEDPCRCTVERHRAHEELVREQVAEHLRRAQEAWAELERRQLGWSVEADA